MSALSTLQQQFHRAIVVGDESGILAKIKGGRIGPAERLRIYRNNVYEGFRTTLAHAFPVIERLVGQGCFRGLALDYFHTFPSRSGDLGDYGQHFPKSLHRRYENSTFDYLTDVARLEWAYQEVMMAADAKVLLPQELAEVPSTQFERLRLHPHPSVRLVASRYPVLGIWQSNRADEGGPCGVNVNGGGESVLLYRTPDSIDLQLINPAEFTMLHVCSAGRSLSEAFEQATQIDPNLNLQHALARAFTLGVFSHYSFAPTDR